MKTETMRDDQQKLISSFMEIAIGQTKDTAIQFLKATSWNLEEAINLFLIHRQNQPLCQQNATAQYWSDYQEEEHIIPPPLPSVRATLYDSSSMYQTPVQVCPEDIWDAESEPSDSKPEASEESRRLSSLYRAPLKLLFQGSFEVAKSTSSRQNLWLLVNLQSTTEFASHMLNRDLWANEVVSQAIESSFILSQLYDDTTEGKKISTFYRIESSPPVVLLIDPITGQKMRSWSGEIEAHGFVEDLMKYMDDGPHEYMASLTRNKRMKTDKSLETKEEDTCSSSNQTITHIVEKDETCLEFPGLTEEPKGDCDKSLVCSVCIRFPDGRRKQRKFLKSEPIQLLWSFSHSQMVESEKKVFKLVQAIPGASKTLEYGANATFDQSGLANSIVSVTWE
ncbi:hypothetical protein N665_0355s0006 [Sinapis alba]|nr:hypothetical protein N665_0355s0006 [Sinapis alba]